MPVGVLAGPRCPLTVSGRMAGMAGARVVRGSRGSDRLAEAAATLVVAGRGGTGERRAERECEGDNEDDAGDETKLHGGSSDPTGDLLGRRPHYRARPGKGKD